MFNSLTGIVTEHGNGYIYLLTSGDIEWTLQTSSSTLRDLPLNERARLLVHTQYKEDDVTLFGFSTEQERALFRNLIKVSGIGPKAAVKAISGWNVPSFILALESGDTSQIANIPGIGKKTAEKIVFTLKGKISSLENGQPNYPEIVDSLANMGFDCKAAQAAVDKTLKELEGKDIDESVLLQQVIIKLSSHRSP